MERLVGRRLGRYEVVAFLGAGGMGSVYRGRDLELDREVAIKVVAESFRDDPERLHRFDREIRAVARLSHPNVVEIHDFGTCDGISFAVMELLKGQTLRERLRGRPIPLPVALEIGAAIANGLGAAHHEGILHRDVKPENVFIARDGAIKLLDFGLARQVGRHDPDAETASVASDLTSSGKVVGTTAYMSPEQLRGQSLDQRSDVFSLGCVLYEMLTGEHPFRRGTTADTVSAILGAEPPPLAECRPDLPPALDLVITRCLAKHPDERFESARDVAFALTAFSESDVDHRVAAEKSVTLPRRALQWTAAAILVVAAAAGGLLWTARNRPLPFPADKRVAVIPFTADDDDARLEQMAAGLTELVGEDLALVDQQTPHPLWVVPPSDARFLGAKTADAMHRTFNANVVLSGRLARAASRLRLTLTAEDPRSGRRMREVTIEGDLGNVSLFQTEPLVRAAEMLDLEAVGALRDRLTREATSVARAFDSYVRAVGILANPDGEASADAAIELLQQAVDSDPAFPPAHEALGRAFAMKYRASREPEWLEKGQEQLRLALDARPSASTYVAISQLHSIEADYSQAARALQRGLELAPESGLIHFLLGRAYQSMGRLDEAERAFQRSSNLRPGYWPGPNRLGGLCFSQGRFDAAANAWRQVKEQAPLFKQGYNNLGSASLQSGRVAQARALFERSIEVDPDGNYIAFSNLGTIYDQEARFADAARMFEKALTINDGSYQVWGNLAYALTFGSEPEQAWARFERAIELAEAQRTSQPTDARLLSRLADYYVMVDRREEAHAMLEETIRLDPRDPTVHANIGETFEDLGDRDRALEWIGRALEGGILPQYFEKRPMLRELSADPRYRQLLERRAAATAESEPSA